MSKIRIIGGRYRGKRLLSPSDRSIRPTSDRAREALFNILDHGGLIAEKCFLDLFCGTGAVGLEAYSRGASDVWLIDRDISLAEANVRALGAPDGLHLRRQDATRLGQPPCRFDVVFLDPPYGGGLSNQALAKLLTGWLAEEATVVVELSAKEPMELAEGWDIEQERHYGAARFVFLKAALGPS
jgi:16S rRNA (guanine966-N2)-methyltransferase